MIVVEPEFVKHLRKLVLAVKKRCDPAELGSARERAPRQTYGYQERNEQTRQEFIEQISVYAKQRFVYIDEAGVDDTLDYRYGYCLKGKRFPALKLGHKTNRVSIIAGWWCGSIIAPMVFQGYCNSQLVCQWIEQFLLPELIPGQIVIIDNASFHPKEKIRKLIKKSGCEVMFLPPYSPDLNKIERFWARLKNHLSKIIDRFDNLIDAVTQVFKDLS